MDKQILIECGIDYEQGLEKFMSNVGLYERLLKNFLTENTFEEAKKAFDSKDYDGVLRAIHTMKSATGTLSMNSLYQKCCKIVDDIRAEKNELIENDFADVYGEYQKISGGIKRA